MRAKYIITGLVLALLLTLASTAEAQTAYKTGENTRGSVKDCFYEYMGQEYVLSVAAYSFCPYSTRVKSPSYTPRIGGTAFKTGENKRGSVKDCYYSLYGKRYTLTIGSYEFCPYTAEVP
jgi:hypothetical protein